MNGLELKYESYFLVRGHDVDMHQRCSPLGIMRLMHEAAMEQVLHFKVSAKELGKNKLGWVVTNQQVEFIQDAHLGDQLKLITYPSALERIFTYRDYLAINQQGQVVAQSKGKFIMMDLVNRKMVRIPEDISNKLQNLNQFYDIERPEKIKAHLDSLQSESEFIVRYSDLDFNKHVGNQSYYKWIFDSFKFDFLSTHQLSKINFEFKAELHISERVKSKIYMISDTQFYHELFEGDRKVAIARTTWKEVAS